MKKVVLLLLICIVFVSCREKTNCERFPQKFIENYLPYAEKQQVKFTNGTDTINFVVTEILVWDSYSFRMEPFASCMGDCNQPVFAKMVDTQKGIELYYEIRSYGQGTITDFSVNVNLFNKDCYFVYNTLGSPHNNNFEDNLYLQYSDGGLYNCKIEKGKGIVSFENTVSSTMSDYWYLINPQQLLGVRYKTSVKKGC